MEASSSPATTRHTSTSKKGSTSSRSSTPQGRGRQALRSSTDSRARARATSNSRSKSPAPRKSRTSTGASPGKPEVLNLSDSDVAAHTRSHDGDSDCSHTATPVSTTSSGESQRGQLTGFSLSDSNEAGFSLSDSNEDALIWGYIVVLAGVLLLLLYAVSRHPWLRALGATSSLAWAEWPLQTLYTSLHGVPVAMLPTGITPTPVRYGSDEISRLSEAYTHRMRRGQPVPEGRAEAVGLQVQGGDAEWVGDVSASDCDRLFELSNNCITKVGNNREVLFRLLYNMQNSDNDSNNENGNESGSVQAAELDVWLGGRLLQEVLGECLMNGGVDQTIDQGVDINKEELLDLFVGCDDTSSVLTAVLDVMHSRLEQI